MRNINLKDIEKALGFELTELQKKVICVPDDEFMKLKAPEGRRNYTTTAAALRLLFSDGDTVIDLAKFAPGGESVKDGADGVTDIKDLMLVSSCANYSGDFSYRRRYIFFCKTVLELYNKLWCAGIPVRDLVYSGREMGILANPENHFNKKSNDLSFKVYVDTSELTALEKTLDRLTEKALRLQNILSGMSVNEGQSDQTR